MTKSFYITSLKIFCLFSIYFVSDQNNESFSIDIDKKTLKEAKKEVKEGDMYYDAGLIGYAHALEHYLKAYPAMVNDAELNMKIGNCYMHSADKKQSLEYLKKAEQLNASNQEIHLLLGKAYHLNLEWDEAIKEYDAYKKTLNFVKDNDLISDIEKNISECKNGKEICSTPLKITITNIGNTVNSKFAEYCPLITADEMMMFFTSRRDNTIGKKKDEFIDDYFEDIYYTEKVNNSWSAPQNIGYPINTEGHDATVGLSPDGQKLLIYKDDNGDGNIYQCELMGTKWSEPEKLNSNINSEYHETSACFSFDGKSIYFISGRTEGYGGKDIYVSKMNKSGDWDKAKNLGKNVNTIFDEEGVFIHPDGKTLYFSSKGHNTMGGYDIFKSVLVRNKWSKPKNLGFPINSADDDVFFVLSANGKHGYYSSIKLDGLGNKDLYMVTFEEDSTIEKEEPKLTLLKGTITDEATSATLEAEIEIINNSKNEVIADIKSNSSTGKYLASLPSGTNFGINVHADGYLFHSENFNIDSSSGYKEIVKDIALKKIEVGNKIILNNIFFDYGKATLSPESIAELQRLLNLMKTLTTLKIEISGHTDNKGSEIFNKELSENRAKAVVDYLVSNGIDKNRLKYEGYGFLSPIASNDSDEGRQLNRRTEFEILSK